MQFESGGALLYLHDRFEVCAPGGAEEAGGRAEAAARRGRAAAWVLFANSTLGNGLFLDHLRDAEMPGLMGARKKSAQSRGLLSALAPSRARSCIVTG